MFKKIIACFTALAIACLAGCGGKRDGETTISAKNNTTSATPDSMSFSAYYVRTDGYNEGIKYPIVTVIKSKDALDNYYKENKDKYNLEKRDPVPPNTDKGFLAQADNYNDAFFNDNVLVLILLEEGSGSVRHEVSKIMQGDEVTDISVKRNVPKVGTDDMAEWHIFVELKKAEYNGSDIKVTLS